MTGAAATAIGAAAAAAGITIQVSGPVLALALVWLGSGSILLGKTLTLIPLRRVSSFACTGRAERQYAAPQRFPEFRVALSNMPSAATWSRMKDFLRGGGEVTFTECSGDGNGYAEFSSKEEMDKAIEKLDKTDFDGSEVSIKSDPGPPIPAVEVKDSRGGGGRGRDRDSGGGRGRDRSRSPAPRARSRSRSPAKRDDRSRSPAKRDERSRSRSPAKRDDRDDGDDDRRRD